MTRYTGRPRYTYSGRVAEYIDLIERGEGRTFVFPAPERVDNGPDSPDDWD